MIRRYAKNKKRANYRAATHALRCPICGERTKTTVEDTYAGWVERTNTPVKMRDRECPNGHSYVTVELPIGDLERIAEETDMTREEKLEHALGVLTARCIGDFIDADGSPNGGIYLPDWGSVKYAFETLDECGNNIRAGLLSAAGRPFDHVNRKRL